MRRAIAVLLLVVTSASAATRTYPGAAPCHASLQACLDGAAAGDRIELVGAGPFDGSLTIAKPLTLAAAAGVTPVLGGAGAGSRTLTITDVGVGDGTTFALDGLTLQHMRVAATIGFADDTTLAITGCTIAHDDAAQSAIDVDAYAPATVSLLRNAITSPGFGIRVVPSLVAPQAITLAIHGNRIGTADAAGSYGGIGLALYGGGSVHAALTSNVIRGVGGCNCGGAGIAVTIPGAAVDAEVDVVNDTIADLPAAGIVVGAPAMGSTLSLQLFNTIVAGASGTAVTLAVAGGAVSLAGGANDWFEPSTVALGGLVAEPPDRTVDPQFVDRAGGDLRLQATSPLIDAGAAAAVASLPPFDAADATRVAGAAIDVGAYEHDGVPLASTTTTTTSTTTPSTSTTTTIPGCGAEVHVATLHCRLVQLADDVRALAPSAAAQRWLVRPLTGAARALDAAASQHGLARLRRLRRVGLRLALFARLLHSPALRSIDAADRLRLAAAARALRRDLVVLARP